MSTTSEFYRDMQKKFTTWAQTRNDIRAAFVVGSQARQDHPADEWSDMDIVFFTSQQDYYLTTKDWLCNMGNIVVSFAAQTAGGDAECLTLFEGGKQVDFVVDTIENLQYIVKNKVVPNNFHRGVKVLVDKDQIAEAILPKEFTAPQVTPLSEELFVQMANQFWFLALYIAKQICRNELWVVKSRDNDIKGILLQMIEWHEKTVHGEEYDTWHAGRFLCEWASKETLDELQNAFAHFDREDSLKALLATITLYKRLARDIVKKMQYDYPVTLEKCVCDWIEKERK